MTLQNITTKKIQINEFETEKRYFAETDDGFDGTAQGYGYKSVEKLKKAYWWYKEGDAWKDKVRNRKNSILNYFRTNKNSEELYNRLLAFFHPDNVIYLAKDGCTYNRKSFLNCYRGVQKPLDELLQKLHIKFSSLTDFFVSIYEDEEKLKEQHDIYFSKKHREQKSKERKLRLAEKYGNDFFFLKKKVKIYCKTNDIPCPHTNAKIYNWFKHLAVEKQNIIQNMSV